MLREERRLRVFENRDWRRIFGPKREEVTGVWGKLYRVIHKSVKHFKNSQQIDYATDHSNS
jgi:hypothetical protein